MTITLVHKNHRLTLWIDRHHDLTKSWIHESRTLTVNESRKIILPMTVLPKVMHEGLFHPYMQFRCHLHLHGKFGKAFNIRTLGLKGFHATRDFSVPLSQYLHLGFQNGLKWLHFDKTSAELEFEAQIR